MHNSQTSDVVQPHFLTNQSVQFDNVTNVEVSGCLIEDQDFGALGEGTSDRYAFLFTARELAGGSLGEMREVCPIESVGYDLVIEVRGSEQGSLMGSAAHENDFIDRETEG